MNAQADLFAAAPADLPDGLRYQEGFLSPDEETELVEALRALPFQPFDFQGHLANRQVVGFGLKYDYGLRKIMEAPPVPDLLLPLRTRIAAFAGHPAEDFVQVLINFYREGAGIGWHRDRPQFADVVGVSLLAPCPFRFRKAVDEGWVRRTLTVEPRSVYLLSGEARNVWEHSIPPMPTERFSITFRTVRPGKLKPRG